MRSQPVEPRDGPEDQARKFIQARIEKAQEKERKRIEVTDAAQEPDPWLRKVRWQHYLEGKDPDRLRTLIQPVREDEGVLAVIHTSFERVIVVCRVHATEEEVGEAALCKVNTIEYGKKVEKPFYMDMKDHTEVKYQTVWLQMLSFIVRAETQWAEEDRPKYRLTSSQKRALDKLMGQAAAFQGVEVTDAERMGVAAVQQMATLDQACLGLCICLLDH